MYRDDKDAAFARADALQRELDRTQAELERTKGKLVASEQARDRLAERLLDREPPAATPPLPLRPRRGPLGMIAFLGALGAISALSHSHSHHAPKVDLSRLELPKYQPALTPEERELTTRTFTLDSNPTGAKVYVHKVYGDDLLGTTPLTRTVLEWTELGTIDLRATGYAPLSMQAMSLPGLYGSAHAATLALVPADR